MALKSKTVITTTTSSGVFSCELMLSEGIVLGVYATGYRCIPIVGKQDGGRPGWNAMLLDGMQTVPNTTVTATVYYREWS